MSVCNHDCFNCIYHDCICTDQQYGSITRDIKNAMSAELNVRAAQVGRLLSLQYTRREIRAMLGITESEYYAAAQKANKNRRQIAV